MIRLTTLAVDSGNPASRYGSDIFSVKAHNEVSIPRLEQAICALYKGFNENRNCLPKTALGCVNNIVDITLVFHQPEI